MIVVCDCCLYFCFFSLHPPPPHTPHPSLHPVHFLHFSRSMRWGESCGCDGDWRVTQNKKGTSSVEWYTGQECNFARVGADFFCPPAEAPISFESSLHTCTYNGPGNVVSCTSGQHLPNGKEREEGQCRRFQFSAANTKQGSCT